MHHIKENSHMTTTDTTAPDPPEAVAAPAPRECEYCGEPLPPSEGRGRPKRFCDRTCRRAARKERQAAEAAEQAAEAAEAPAAEEKPKPKAKTKAKAKKAE